ncbi:MAG: FeoB small GTPase domain-containing protein [bacterium]
MKRILLVGNPNVGKSVLFSKLTGVNVCVSNYPGTTVEYTRGYRYAKEGEIEIIDVPGIYSLEPCSKAEQVAACMLQQADIVINVVDATNLERNLFLTTQLLETKMPIVVALNIWDETKHKGIEIDVENLSAILGVPVIPLSARSGVGLDKLLASLKDAKAVGAEPLSSAQRWQRIGEIVRSVQRISHHHHTFLERLQDASIHPIGGYVVALLVIGAAFALVRLIGESIVNYIMDPLFQDLYMPLIVRIDKAIEAYPLLHDLLVGRRIDGAIDFIQSFGVISTGLYVEIAVVLPYVVAFYLILGLLEDIGYLPRLAVLLDGFMHMLGLHGYSVVPTLLGLGCNVPALLATRILESKRERFIVATMISIAVPCTALQAMVFGLLGPFGIRYVAAVYAVLFVVWVILGLTMRLFTKGFIPALLMEIPPYRAPYLTTLVMKFRIRTLGFLKEALPVVLIGVAAINFIYSLGVIDEIARFTTPVMTRILGLPDEAVVAVIVGFLRKDVGVGMLAPLGLSVKQLIVGCTTLAMFFPCIATFTLLFKELGLVDTLKSVAVMVVTALTVGGTLNLLL